MKAFFKLLLLLTKIFLMCNIAACGFFYLSDNVCGLWTDCSDCCWIRKTEFNGESLKKIDQFSLQYTYSLYWASTTMISIGYGDITPQNQY